MNELDELRAQAAIHEAALAAADRDLHRAVLRAYRATRGDETPRFTLAEIGAALGVSRQRVYQLVRKLAASESDSAAKIN